jgi:tRNA dimethylallyltransferase
MGALRGSTLKAGGGTGWPRMKNANSPLIAIFGPTASGKSAVAEAVADRIPAELVSADSMQVYRSLPILTNQPTRPTRLVAIWNIDHEVSAGEYAQLAHAAVDEIRAHGRTPIVVGGTGLYLRAALSELELPAAPAPGTRARFERIYDRLGPESTHRLLAERDPDAAARVHPNDRRRVVRALELVEAGGTLAPTRDRLWSLETRLPTLVFGLEVPKDVLARRIAARTRAMFENGVEEEVARALAGTISTTARHVIGLREIAELPRTEATEAITRRTLRYAAYQRKWMRRIPGLIPLEADRPPIAVAGDILDALEQFTRLGGQEPAISGVRKGEADHTGHAV